jgi:hypothetical protein
MPEAAETKDSSHHTRPTRAGELRVERVQEQVYGNSLLARYQIINDTEQDIWLCDDADRGRLGAHVYQVTDPPTLVIRRRLEIPRGIFRMPPVGLYRLLRSGETRTESVVLPPPVVPRPLSEEQTEAPQMRSGKAFEIEIGYCVGDLPLTLRSMLEGSAGSDLPLNTSYGVAVITVLEELRRLSGLNEGLLSREECLLIASDYGSLERLEGEQILAIPIDNPPSTEASVRHKRVGWDLASCTRIELHFEPSLLEFAYPYVSQQRLLSREEKAHLGSQRTVVLRDRECIESLMTRIAKGRPAIFAVEDAVAHVMCYGSDGLLSSFTVYANSVIETQNMERFACVGCLDDLKRGMPELESFELRSQCAVNLQNLWHRLLLYYEGRNEGTAEILATSRVSYPPPDGWTDAVVDIFADAVMLRKAAEEAFKCPGMREARSYYAMNPNCGADSPGDMVLLFETKAGWNQHGGPELFTFDNHDPKGGCVLLNDGTVRFIRTEEELHALRWK